MKLLLLDDNHYFYNRKTKARAFKMLSDDKNFKRFFQEYFEPVYRFVQHFTAETEVAKDIAQDSFVRLYEKRENFTSVEQAKSFVYITAKNLCMDYFKHKRIEEQYREEYEPEEETPSYLEEITYQETLRMVRAAIDQLPPKSREIMLKALDGKSNNEIAEEMGISINTLKTLKKSAYKTLRTILNKHLSLLLFL